MAKNLRVLLFMLLIACLSVFCLTWGFGYDWPDFYHIDHGLPLVWGRHTLSTIAGPVDRWGVQVEALVVDLAFWLGLQVLGVYALLRVEHRGSAVS